MLPEYSIFHIPVNRIIINQNTQIMWDKVQKLTTSVIWQLEVYNLVPPGYHSSPNQHMIQAWSSWIAHILFIRLIYLAKNS